MSILIKRFHYLTSRQGIVKPLATGCWQWSHAWEWLNAFYNCAGTADLHAYAQSHPRKHTCLNTPVFMNACMPAGKSYWKQTSRSARVRNRWTFNFTRLQHPVILFIHLQFYDQLKHWSVFWSCHRLPWQQSQHSVQTSEKVQQEANSASLCQRDLLYLYTVHLSYWWVRKACSNPGRSTSSSLINSS